MFREPRWWPAELTALTRYKQAVKLGDRVLIDRRFRRLSNICAAHRRWDAERSHTRRAA